MVLCLFLNIKNKFCRDSIWTPPGIHRIQVDSMVDSMDSRWSPWIPGGIIQFCFCFGIPPGLQVESMFPCGICGVHLESMGEGKVHSFLASKTQTSIPKSL